MRDTLNYSPFIIACIIIIIASPFLKDKNDSRKQKINIFAFIAFLFISAYGISMTSYFHAMINRLMGNHLPDQNIQYKSKQELRNEELKLCESLMSPFFEKRNFIIEEMNNLKPGQNRWCSLYDEFFILTNSALLISKSCYRINEVEYKMTLLPDFERTINENRSNQRKYCG